MENNNNETKEPAQDIQILIRQLAQSRANTAKWDINILVFLFAILITVILLIAFDIDMVIVTGIAIIGLISVLLFGSRRGGKLVQRFYEEEMQDLQQNKNWESPSLDNVLSKRELEILELVAQGFSNKMISAQLGISINTVKILISRTMTKLEANDRTEAVVIAIKQNLISI